MKGIYMGDRKRKRFFFSFVKWVKRERKIYKEEFR